MRTRIRELLVTRIVDGTYPAGFHLKEMSLAAEFSVSQAPVREALRELEAMGLVSSEAYRGTRVRGFDIAETLDAYELRATIEVRSVELAIPVPAAICAALAQDLERFAAAIASAEPDRHLDHALAFHRRLVEASGLRSFLRTWDGFHWDVRARRVLREISAQADAEHSLRLHQAILDRVQAGDAVGASRAIRDAFESFLSLLRQARQRALSTVPPRP